MTPRKDDDDRFGHACRVAGALMLVRSGRSWSVALLGTVICSLSVLVPAPLAWSAFPGRDGLLAIQPVDGRGLVLVGAGGGGGRRICTDRALCGRPVRPRWSPDGSELVFGGSFGSRVGIVSAAGTCVWCDTNSPSSSAHVADASFGSDGSFVTFISRGALWRLDVDGSNLRRLLPGPFADAVWSSTGEVAVVRAGQVLVGNGGSRAPRFVARGRNPSFSPAGSQIALVRGGWVWLVRVHGRRSRRLVRGGAPAWSPDGRSIAYVGARSGVYVVAARGGRSRRVGRVRGSSVDWQPVRQYGRCTLAGATVLANSAGTVVYSRVIAGPSDSHVAWYGCQRAVGRERLLQSGPGSGTATLGLERVALAGHYVALAFFFFDQYFTDDAETIGVYDLSTGKGAPSIPTTCASLYEPCEIDSLVLNSSGFSAWDAPETIRVYGLAGISCASAALCVAVDDYGNALTATNPTRGVTGWTVANVDGSASLTGIACPSAGMCVAVDLQGDAVTSTDPTGGASGWTTALIDAGNALAGVSCPSVALCVAVDHSGQILTSTDPTGGAAAWTAANIDPGNDLAGVSCPSAVLCVAVDRAGRILTSTNPTGGPAAWTSRQIAGLATGDPPPGFAGVSCPSTSMCVATGTSFGTALPGVGPPAGGRAVVSTNPTGGATAWTSMPVGPVFSSPSSVSCASVSLCVIATPGGIVSSTNPSGGQAAWSNVSLGGGAYSAIPGISCPSVVLCAAVDTRGNIITSTNPPGNANAWTVTSVDLPPCAGSPPCQAEGLYVHDDQGTRLIDSIKVPGRGNSLANLILSGNQLTWTHNGTPRTATLG
jgi:hypothetical protein